MICPKCNADKDEACFWRGRKYSCKQCESYTRTAYKLNISYQDVLEVVLTETICGICASDTKLCIDHCHDTGKVRGRLCSNCNRALGLFQDNVEFLESATQYLKVHSANEN